MSQVPPSLPQNDAMILSMIVNVVYNSRGVEKCVSCISRVNYSSRYRLQSHFQVLDEKNIKGIMCIFCPEMYEMVKSFGKDKWSPIMVQLV